MPGGLGRAVHKDDVISRRPLAQNVVQTYDDVVIGPERLAQYDLFSGCADRPGDTKKGRAAWLMRSLSIYTNQKTVIPPVTEVAVEVTRRIVPPVQANDLKTTFSSPSGHSSAISIAAKRWALP
jgi:hypothetical protein